VEALERALDLAYRHLAQRDRTVAEVRRQLERKRVDTAAIDAAVADLCELGYLDDARYARRFVEDRRTLDAWGAERIARRLRAAGVAPDLIEAAVGPAGGESELGAAVDVLRRRFRRPPSDDRDRNRALGVLARKGYDLELAHEAIRAFERAG
jgi:regulatory protein